MSLLPMNFLNYRSCPQSLLHFFITYTFGFVLLITIHATELRLAAASSLQFCLFSNNQKIMLGSNVTLL